MGEAEETRETVLELLSNGPSSFAALYGYVVRTGVATSVGSVLQLLELLEEEGHVRAVNVTDGGEHRVASRTVREEAAVAYVAWLEPLPPERMTAERLSVDEIGLWFQMTAAGLEAWRTCATKANQAWAVDDDAEQQLVSVYAGDLAMAQRVLLEWLQQHEGTNQVPETQEIEPVAEHRLRSGRHIKDGVRLRVSYRRPERS